MTSQLINAVFHHTCMSCASNIKPEEEEDVQAKASIIGRLFKKSFFNNELLYCSQ